MEEALVGDCLLILCVDLGWNELYRFGDHFRDDYFVVLDYFF